MAFISSSTTVNVEATLTFEGKKRLYRLIEGDAQFISRFTLGDSDANYKVIPTAGSLTPGKVPETGDFKPRPRSKLLYQGMFRPGKPVVFIDSEPGEVTRQLAIGNNAAEGVSFNFELSTQWPTGDDFVEDYWVELSNPTVLSDDAFNRIFNLEKIGTHTWRFSFTGDISIAELAVLTGSIGDAQTDVVIPIVGAQTNKETSINVVLVY